MERTDILDVFKQQATQHHISKAHKY